jgi:prepilin-type N-terminal cleavage/methylation domain-containing protein
MPELRTDHARLAPTRTPERERAFTLIEIIVVMAILAILMGAIVISFRGAKSSTYHKEGIATGGSYVQSISSYQADHANRNPDLGTLDPRTGPLNLLSKPYLKNVPEPVDIGRVSVSAAALGGANCNGTASGGAGVSHVSICLGTEPEFAVRVATRPNAGASWGDPETKLCWLGPSNQTPRC